MDGAVCRLRGCAGYISMIYSWRCVAAKRRLLRVGLIVRDTSALEPEEEVLLMGKKY